MEACWPAVSVAPNKAGVGINRHCLRGDWHGWGPSGAGPIAAGVDTHPARTRTFFGVGGFECLLRWRSIAYRGFGIAAMIVAVEVDRCHSDRCERDVVREEANRKAVMMRGRSKAMCPFVVFGLLSAGAVHAQPKAHFDCGRDVVRNDIVVQLGAPPNRMVGPRPAAGLTIQLNAGPGLAANPQALATFQAAAAVWESRFSDPVTVVIDADLAALGAGILGSTGSRSFVTTYTSIRNAMVGDAAADEAIVSQLPSLAAFNVILPTGFTFQTDLLASKANFRALGFDMSFDDPNADASITFSTGFLPDFDFDPSDGITPGKFDFEAIVVHELGHALGFISTVDTVDFFLDSGQTAAVTMRTLDMFRLRPGDAAIDFTGSSRIGSPGNLESNQQFFDGSVELGLSTGSALGDGRQASHWKDNGLTGVLVGVMDPTIARGVVVPVTGNDVRAFGLIGWDTTCTVDADCDDGLFCNGAETCLTGSCVPGTSPCDPNAACTDVAGGFTCSCNAGYTGDGVTCTDVDECATGADNCNADATCTNTAGSFTCACNAGYTGDGVTCTDVDECATGADNCNVNATCTNTVGSFTCACNAGYTGDGVTCSDVDECATGADNCNVNATCTNTVGSFTCACNAGYTGDGVTCTDVDECATGADNCNVNATCTNTVGSFTCACNAGYTGDGVTCTDIDECATGADNCNANATCTNTAGSFTCSCNAGYTGDGVTCTDIDECATGTDNCNANATCTNTAGSFTCSCNAGYTGDGVTCTDIDECATGADNCNANATCTNTAGSFTCACNPGYIGDGVTCTPDCGDGQILGGEECDDGNTGDGDGCSSSCIVEAGFTCTGQPSVCVMACVDDRDCARQDVCHAGTCPAGTCVQVVNLYGDIDRNGSINLFDLFCVLEGFTGDFTNCTFDDVDIEPCVPNGTLNLLDLFAILDSFSGADPCCSAP